MEVRHSLSLIYGGVAYMVLHICFAYRRAGVCMDEGVSLPLSRCHCHVPNYLLLLTHIHGNAHIHLASLCRRNVQEQNTQHDCAVPMPKVRLVPRVLGCGDVWADGEPYDDRSIDGAHVSTGHVCVGEAVQGVASDIRWWRGGVFHYCIDRRVNSVVRLVGRPGEIVRSKNTMFASIQNSMKCGDCVFID